MINFVNFGTYFVAISKVILKDLKKAIPTQKDNFSKTTHGRPSIPVTSDSGSPLPLPQGPDNTRYDIYLHGLYIVLEKCATYGRY